MTDREKNNAHLMKSMDKNLIRPTRLPWLSGIDASGAQLSLGEKLAISLGRAKRWEFWPWWLYYVPIVVWIIWLGIKHRSPMAFTAVNPILGDGGMAGERKHVALDPLQKNAPDLVATFTLVASRSIDERIQSLLEFVERVGLPVVLKPDVGQRGRGVLVARDIDSAQTYLSRFSGDVILQRYVDGEEFGVFVARSAKTQTPEILSIVHKTFPVVVGDGVSTLHQLILNDARAKLISAMLFKRWVDELDTVPEQGVIVKLVEIGAHSRGSVFLDGNHYASMDLLRTMTRLLDAVPGYSFGRIDLRAPSVDHFREGRGLQVMELNGVSAESAHIYHPDTPILVGYRAMFKQWSLAFVIGKENIAAGVPTTSPLDLWRRFREDIERGERWF